MTLDVEVVRAPEGTYAEGMLVFVAVWRLGLAKSIHEAVVLQSNGAVLVDGQAASDLNTRIQKGQTIVVGLHGVEVV